MGLTAAGTPHWVASQQTIGETSWTQRRKTVSSPHFGRRAASCFPESAIASRFAERQRVCLVGSVSPKQSGRCWNTDTDSPSTAKFGSGNPRALEVRIRTQILGPLLDIRKRNSRHSAKRRSKECLVRQAKQRVPSFSLSILGSQLCLQTSCRSWSRRSARSRESGNANYEG